MDFCNNFAVTICHKPSFSGILKKTINATSFLNFFSDSVTAPSSQRNELLSKKQDGLFPEIALPLR
jgi:hypothetical protein